MSINSEELIIDAGVAIAHWKQHSDSPCFLAVEDGSVVAENIKVMPKHHPDCLSITKFRQQAGFSSVEWHSIGTALFILYTKELACQAHQKP